MDYQRGLETARADARLGWARCWMPARQLAEEAVYCPGGLSLEQQGYAAGLDECFPGGLAEIDSFLARVRTLGTPMMLRADGGLEPHPCPPSAQSVDRLVRGAARWANRPWGKEDVGPTGALIALAGPAKEPEKTAPLARFV